jgi:hypothetical protein
MAKHWGHIAGGGQLLIFGLGMCALAAGDRYLWFLNPQYRWLTMTGGGLILAMGLAALTGAPSRFRLFPTLVFCLFFTVAAAGRPWALPRGTAEMAYFMMGANSPDARITLGGQEYRQVSAPELYAAAREPDAGIQGERFSLWGLVLRSPEMDHDGHLAVVGPMIWCCLADATALGFRVPLEGWTGLGNGQWVEVYGVLKRLDPPLDPPPLKMDGMMFTTLSDQYLLVPDQVIVRPAPANPFVYR